jgi:hypothetical protein
MAYALVPTWDLDPSNNGNKSDIPMFEGMQPAQINDAVRNIMAAVRQEHDTRVGVEDGITAAYTAAIAAAVLAATNGGLYAQTGDEKFSFATACAGWVQAHGGTIGSAASGATARANADTQNLFTLFWNTYNNATLPIQDSAGAPSVRGASAAADFAANKRLPVFDIRDRAMRGASNGSGYAVANVAGVVQADAMQGHFHTLPNLRQVGAGASFAGSGAGDNVSGVNSTGAPSDDGTNGVPRTATETRMMNIAANPFIKL